MFLTAIVAMDRKGLIGANGKIPWHLPSDLKRFRRLTMGKPVIMGRKTWESLPGPLEGRTNIVVSLRMKLASLRADTVNEVPKVVGSILTADTVAQSEGYEAAVIGGSGVYSQTLHICHRICLTVVDGDFEGDTYFPLHLLEGRYWKVVSQEHHAARHSLAYPGDAFANFYYELVEKRHPGEGAHEIWHWVDRKAYEEATGR